MPLLPVGARDTQSEPMLRRRWRLSPRYRLLVAVAVAVLILLNLPTLIVLRRDAGYLLRPLWDNPERPFRIIPHYPRPVSGAWCTLHGWSERATPPTIVDAVPLSTELDLLEIRMREYAPLVSVFVVAEADATFAGAPKPLHFNTSRAHFEAVAAELGVEIAYTLVTGFQRVSRGSFTNEVKQRAAIASTLTALAAEGRLPPGSLVLQSDVDEIVSRDTLELLAACQVPDILHLNVRNYRYDFDHPLRDAGYWRPHVVTTGHSEVGYSHQRDANELLADAGWHCSFCFPTLEDIRTKMAGYSHNDRLTSSHLLDEKRLRARVCTGQDPFNMWPEAFSFRDLVAQSGAVRKENSFVDVPRALREHPERWPYLLSAGCERPDN